MKKIIYTLFLLAASSQFHAQVGIGTSSPNNSAMLEVNSSDKGILFPRMTSAQRNAIVSPAIGLYVFDTNSNSLWYFNGALWINTVSEASLGDVKSGFQSTDHSGWILLDGRPLTSLTPNQQAAATAIGFTTSLPDATNAYLSQNGGLVGAVTGTNTTTVTQANLPNINFTGTTASAGNHNHSVDPAPVSTSSNGNHNHITDPAAVNTSAGGNHTHSLNMVDADDGNFSNVNGQYPTGDASKFNGADHYVSTEAAGNHSHSVNIPATTSTTAGAHTHTVDIPSTNSTTTGAHIHNVTVSSGGSDDPIDITPRSLTVNMFVYLGQ